MPPVHYSFTSTKDNDQGLTTILGFQEQIPDITNATKEYLKIIWKKRLTIPQRNNNIEREHNYNRFLKYLQNSYLLSSLHKHQNAPLNKQFFTTQAIFKNGTYYLHFYANFRKYKRTEHRGEQKTIGEKR